MVLWVATLEQGSQIIAGHLTRQADSAEPPAPPPARRFIRVEVIVDRATGCTGRVGPVIGQTGVVSQQATEASARRLQRRTPHHRIHPEAGRAGGRARANALVCCSTMN